MPVKRRKLRIEKEYHPIPTEVSSRDTRFKGDIRVRQTLSTVGKLENGGDVAYKDVSCMYFSCYLEWDIGGTGHPSRSLVQNHPYWKFCFQPIGGNSKC